MRRQPVAFFLGDAAFLSDPKFRQLMRRLPDADDFNSAVGAYFVALAAARRNGLPSIDIAAETQSRFIEDLCAVGLLCSEGFPEGPFAQWAPSRPKFASDSRTLRVSADAPSATNVTNAPSATNSPFTPARKPSTPLPSTLLTSDVPPARTPAREGLPNLDATIAKLWEEATGRSVLASGAYAAEYLDDGCRRHPPSEVGAAIIRARKTFDHIPDAAQMVSAMRPILDPLPDRKGAASREAEAEAKRASERRRSDTLRRTHELGAHAAEPNRQCPTCIEVAG